MTTKSGQVLAIVALGIAASMSTGCSTTGSSGIALHRPPLGDHVTIARETKTVSRIGPVWPEKQRSSPVLAGDRIAQN